MTHAWEVPVAELEMFLLERAQKIHHLHPGLTIEQAAQVIALEAETLVPEDRGLVARWQVWPAADLHCFYARHLTARPPIVVKAETVLDLREQVLAPRAMAAAEAGPRLRS